MLTYSSRVQRVIAGSDNHTHTHTHTPNINYQRQCSLHSSLGRMSLQLLPPMGRSWRCNGCSSDCTGAAGPFFCYQPLKQWSSTKGDFTAPTVGPLTISTGIFGCQDLGVGATVFSGYYKGTAKQAKMGASMVVQWLRLCAPNPRAQVHFLVEEPDPTCHNYRSRVSQLRPGTAK